MGVAPALSGCFTPFQQILGQADVPAIARFQGELLHGASYVGYPGILYGYTCRYYMSVFRALFRPGYGDILETF